MAERRPLVLINGRYHELPAHDSLSGVSVQGEPLYAEPVVVAGFNDSVIHGSSEYPIPMFVTSSDGDIVTAGV